MHRQTDIKVYKGSNGTLMLTLTLPTPTWKLIYSPVITQKGPCSHLAYTRLGTQRESDITMLVPKYIQLYSYMDPLGKDNSLCRA